MLNLSVLYKRPNADRSRHRYPHQDIHPYEVMSQNQKTYHESASLPNLEHGSPYKPNRCLGVGSSQVAIKC